MTDPHRAADGLVRVYPARAPHGAGLVWAHGGGFRGGDLDMPEADHVARTLAARGTTVVSVDYRRVGPGCRFPAPSDDMVRAWEWTCAHADRLRIDPARLTLGGASAGGNLAAGTVLRLLADGTATLPALVLLAYPTLLAVQPAPDPALRAALDADPAADRFPPATVREMYEAFLGAAVESAPVIAVPGRATTAELAGFPPTLIVTSEVDELRVSADVFAATLAAAGCEVRAIAEPGTTHGHLNRPEAPGAAATLDRFAACLAARPLTPSALPSRDPNDEGPAS